MAQTVTALVLVGSRRAGALSRRVQTAIAQQLATQGLHPDVVQPHDLTAPLYDGDLEDAEGVPLSIQALNARMAAAQALVIVSPEYNAMFPPLLKNTLDWMSRRVGGQPGGAVFKDKPVLLVATSRGPRGGIRALPHLRFQMAYFEMQVYGPQLSIGDVEQKVDATGEVTDSALAQEMQVMAAGFAEFCRKLSA